MNFNEEEARTPKQFLKEMKRDIFILLCLGAFTAIAVVLLGYYGAKYDW
jgi:hypothetical protein